ncbi:MBL fold metallo-hydrolase [Palleronia sp.]|uniref:MBL fold metallo-hydrolase n=1 Tax=Palleronia sp. TaxID=1940284 RepID=UPI0035C79BA9
MSDQIPLDPHDRVRDPAPRDHTREVAEDLAYRRLGIVNVAFHGRAGAGDRDWVLVDAGVSGTMGMITEAAAERFGPDARPAAIVLTHGHFDHVGALEDLVALWDVPVYAHALEMPYLDGSASYPLPDPGVGGLMARLSPLYPRSPVNVARHLQRLPEDGSVPGMPGWRWIHTPGHCPGHVSLWREEDRTIIAGDAFVTTNQESAYAVAVQKPEMHGPPQYLTTDWQASAASVETLARLEPEVAVTGHGPAMRGAEMRGALHTLARDFAQVAVPEGGRYVGDPAQAEDGSAYRSD